MLYGARYFYLDFWTPGFPVEDKIWLNDDSDEENLILENIYSSEEYAEIASYALKN